MNRFSPILLALAVAAPGVSAQAVGSVRPLVEPETEQRIDALLERMTLDEKIGQLNQYSNTFNVTGPPPEQGAAAQRHEHIRSGLVGSMLNVTGAAATRRAQELAVEGSRLGIPLLFGFDVIHGYRTIFPIPLGEAASWDLDAVRSSAEIAAREAAAAGVHWTFAPMVDIARDARWGRIMEGSGEDPYLGARMAAARVRGFQGADLADLSTVAACAKHFAGYGFAEAGRDYNTVDVGAPTLREVILPPFEAAVDAGAVTVMNAFNVLNGIPATGSSLLQREFLKSAWGFQGFVVSDYSSIQEMINHGVARDEADAARLAITAGSDMDMESEAYVRHLRDLVESGAVDEALVDEAVRRILRVKFALGLFDDPYRYSDEDREAANTYTPEHLAVARDVARKSIVLLKNDGDLLPLEQGPQTIAVIGALATDKDSPLGSWRAQGGFNTAVSLLEGLEAAVGPETTLRYATGYELTVGQRSFVSELTFETDDRSGFPEAVSAAAEADVVVMAMGEDAFQTGEGRSQADISLKGLQEELLREVLAVNRNVVVVLMNGRPLAIPYVAENVPAIVEAWHLGSEAGHAIADVLFGAYNPSGKLPVSFPRSVGQVPIYYNHLPTGRPDSSAMVFWSHYTDAPNSPLYPFGHGLSYTTFSYSDLRVGSPEMARDGELTVSVDISNTGDRAGTEVAQLYVRDLVGSRSRPVKELKGFQKVELDPGESTTVTFTLRAEDLAFLTARETWEVEPGDFMAFVGGSSTDVLEIPFAVR